MKITIYSWSTRLRKHPEFGYLTPLETRTRLQQDFTPAA
jgi:hypothetical protein